MFGRNSPKSEKKKDVLMNKTEEWTLLFPQLFPYVGVALVLNGCYSIVPASGKSSQHSIVSFGPDQTMYCATCHNREFLFMGKQFV